MNATQASRIRRVGICSGALLLAASVAHAQPVNDHCIDAIEMTPGVPVTGSTTSATTGDDITTCTIRDIRDVWYKFTAVQDGLARLSLCSSSFDTSVAVFESCDGVELACDDNGCGASRRSSLTLSVDGGQTYYVRISGFNGGTGFYNMSLLGTAAGGTGPDVIVGELPSVQHYGPVGDVHAYAVGTTSCNIGDEELQWIANNTEHPVIGQNLYRVDVDEGRIEMLGMTWLKHGFTALQGSVCVSEFGPCTPSGTGSRLGIGCSDPYGAGLNGSQGGMGPRSEVNAATGEYVMPHGTLGLGLGALDGRIRATEADLSVPNAVYLVEGQYVTLDDTIAGNGANNASYRRVNVSQTSFNMTMSGPTRRQRPAIMAWRDHGLGANQIDNDVVIRTLDIPGDGRFYVGAKARDLGNGMWRYEYVVHNLTSDLSGSQFSVPLPTGVTVENVEFKDVDYDREPYDGTDWDMVVGDNEVSWTCSEAFADNPNANALRWGTMYNFRFDADVAPADGTVMLGLFKELDEASAFVPVPGGCPCDVDGVAGVDFADVLHYLELYFDFDPSVERTGDSTINVLDFLVFLDCYFGGCP